MSDGTNDFGALTNSGATSAADNRLDVATGASTVQPRNPSQALGALMDRRLALEERLLEFDAVLKQLKAARLPSTAAPAVADMQRAVERLDSDLTHLAGVVHDLCAELEQHALVGASALQVEAVIFVRAGDRIFAVRANDVEEICAWHGGAPAGCQVISLRDALALPKSDLAGNKRLLRLCGIESGALLVDDVVRQDEVVIRTLGPLLAGLKLYSGAAVASRGELVPVVAASEIVARAQVEASVS
jgi:hypothetical protein